MTYLHITDLEDILDTIIYRPGWDLEVYETETQGLWFAVTAEVADSYNPTGPDVELRIKSPLPPFETDKEFLRWVRWRLESIEVHECHEWLRWADGGEAIWNPHAQGADETE